MSGGRSTHARGVRPAAHGKFLYRGQDKVYLSGVTYGTFGKGADGSAYPPYERVREDFAQMAACGINTVRTYTVPPYWLLDVAYEHGIQLMVGIAWEQHVTFLDEPRRRASIENKVRRGVAACAGHPAVLCYLIGNEIAAPLVRWYGARRVEQFLRRLYLIAKEKDPGALVSYVNFPSTEYLRLPFLDLVCFNVFLEQQPSLDSYLARLQNIAGDRPLVLTEVGLDSQSQGEVAQAESLAWQIRSVYRAGAAGCVVFSWTDDWYRNGEPVEGWSFGLTDRERVPKPALEAARAAFAEAPLSSHDTPRVSVVVCTHNGASRIADCLTGLGELAYPDYEVIVVDDGSTDATVDIARRFPVRTITTQHVGLSAARNLGAEAATGTIVAYLDDDCRPDPHWLDYLAATFTRTDFVGVGGPNIPPPGQGVVARCVARAPGAPIHVLLSDSEAEHIPGCNMAFRRDALLAVGGFDRRFRIAGDDVDICWALQAAGGRIGFHPAALVWHRRRTTLRGYLRQQKEYGKAEALLEDKWPERYNAWGHARWTGRLYAGVRPRRRQLVHYGEAGNGLFQAASERPEGHGAQLPLTPEWYLLCLLLAALVGCELLTGPTWGTLPGGVLTAAQLALIAACAVPLALAWRAGRCAFPRVDRRRRPLGPQLLTALMYLAQPAARLAGRIVLGLTPWRRERTAGLTLPRRRKLSLWSEEWSGPEMTLKSFETELRRGRAGAVRRGSGFDRWDVELRNGTLGGARLRLVTEEHGNGKRVLRFHVWPRISLAVPALALGLAGLSILAMLHHSLAPAVAFAAGAGLVLVRAVLDSGRSVWACARVALDGTLGAAMPEGLGRWVATEDDEDALAETPQAPRARSARRRDRRRWPTRRRRARAEAAPAAQMSADDGSAVRERRRRRLPALGTRGAWETWKYVPRVLPYLRSYKRLAVLSTVLMVIAAVMGLAYPWPLAFMVDTVLGHHRAPGIIRAIAPGGQYGLLIFAAGAGLLLTIVGNIATVLQEYTNTKLEQRLVLDFRSDLFEHAQRLSVTFHDESKTGQLMSQVNYESEAVGSLIMSILPLVQSALTLVGMFYVAFQVDPVLALLALTVVPFIYYSVGFYSAKIVPRLQFVRGLEWETFSIIYEALNMLRVVVAFGRERHEFRRFRKQGETAVAARVNLTVRQTVFSLVVNTCTAAGTALVLGVGAYHVLHHRLTVGDLLVVIAYIAAVYKPLEEISSALGGLQQQLVMIQGAFMLLDTPAEIRDSPGAIDVARVRGDVEFEDVSFTYRSRPETLKHISFRVPAGSCVAVVGETGAGKTTLISLIKRFYDPHAGSVRIDGLDVRGITLSSLREQISVVLQTPQLFSGTVRENIRYGRLDATDADIEEAARSANAHDFISALPAGYDTELGENGAQLSGGERQRICVARAFLKDAPILILDEPTSSIDSKTEAVILDALDELMVGRTTFVIAHRLSTVRHADRILVLSHGEIVQQGVHEELVAQDGLYRELHEAQTRTRRRLGPDPLDALEAEFARNGDVDEIDGYQSLVEQPR